MAYQTKQDEKQYFTFMEAFEEKFADIDLTGLDCIQLSISTKDKIKEKRNQQRLTHLSLDGSGITHAGEPCLIQETCPNITDLDISHNSISHWDQVIIILRQLPNLSFLNLSHNPLAETFKSDFADGTDDDLPCLKKLALSNTGVTIESLKNLLNVFPNVQELHISLNEFGCIPDPSTAFDSVEQLYTCNCNINHWDEINNLGKLFPRINSFVISENSFSSITNVDAFHHLKSLSMCKTDIDDWEAIDQLNSFPALEILRITQVKFLDDYDESIRRQLLIARLPNIVKLNGGSIEKEERENAERAFIRHYANTDAPPTRYYELIKLHGEVHELVDIDLTPRRFAYIGLIHNGSGAVPMKVNVHLTVKELKVKIANRFEDLDPNAIHLYYIDPEAVDVIGREDMNVPNKKLYRYNIKDGDSIQIEKMRKYNGRALYKFANLKKSFECN